MKINYGKILDMDFSHEEGKLATEILSGVIERTAGILLDKNDNKSTEKAVEIKEVPVEKVVEKIVEKEVSSEADRAEIEKLSAQVVELEEELCNLKELNSSLNNSNESLAASSFRSNVDLRKMEYYDGVLREVPFGKISLVNCTAHPVLFQGSDGIVESIDSSGCVTRVEYEHNLGNTRDYNGINLVNELITGVINIPQPKENTLYIVSRIVYDTLYDREDLICPNSIKASRTDSGSVAYVPSFISRIK